MYKEYKNIESIDILNDMNIKAETISAREMDYFIYLIFNNNIRLKWKTQYECNNYGFEIERDFEGEWKLIGFMPSYSGQIYEYTDYNLKPGFYKYRLKQLDKNGTYKYFPLDDKILIKEPRKYLMSQNFPNPYSTATKILIELPYEEFVTLKIFDTGGREVANIFSGFKRAGTHEIEFKNEKLPPALYYYEIVAGSFSERKLMTIIK